MHLSLIRKVSFTANVGPSLKFEARGPDRRGPVGRAHAQGGGPIPRRARAGGGRSMTLPSSVSKTQWKFLHDALIFYIF